MVGELHAPMTTQVQRLNQATARVLFSVGTRNLSRNGHLGSHETRSSEAAEKRLLAFTLLLVSVSDDAV